MDRRKTIQVIVAGFFLASHAGFAGGNPGVSAKPTKEEVDSVPTTESAEEEASTQSNTTEREGEERGIAGQQHMTADYVKSVQAREKSPREPSLETRKSDLKNHKKYLNQINGK